mgnify:CR=1 FL=1
MTDIIRQLEAEQAEKILEKRKLPDFSPGDTVRVQVRVTEGKRTRLQAYEGVCIARSGGGVNESFTVRKISYGEGVERVFPVYSPMLDSVEVVRRGKVRRAGKLRRGRQHLDGFLLHLGYLTGHIGEWRLARHHFTRVRGLRHRTLLWVSCVCSVPLPFAFPLSGGHCAALPSFLFRGFQRRTAAVRIAGIFVDTALDLRTEVADKPLDRPCRGIA